MELRGGRKLDKALGEKALTSRTDPEADPEAEYRAQALHLLTQTAPLQCP